MIEFFKGLNRFEKIMFILLQGSACALPFLMLAALGTLHEYWVMGTAALLVVAGLLLKYSYNKRMKGKDKMTFTFNPSFRFGNKIWRTW